MKITFTNVSGFDDLEKPVPASKIIPNWYKNLDSYMGKEKKPDGNGKGRASIKRCMPVFDAMTAGYIVTLPADVYVRKVEGGEHHFEWASLGLIQFHPVDQAPAHPLSNGMAYPKWTTHWSIKTPKGYSTLFVQPMHRESVMTIFPGIVDTDEYYAPVNFPFVMNDPDFEGLIPKGTPLGQLIPFKREPWVMEFGGEEEVRKQENSSRMLMTKFFDRYKSQFRQPKEYK